MEIGIINSEVNQIESKTKLSLSVVLDDHSCCWQKDTPKRLTCVNQRNSIEVLVNEINQMILENKLLKRKTLCYTNSNRSCLTWCKIKTNPKMNFYIGILTIEMFNVIFILIKRYLPNIVYGTAPAKHRLTSTKIKKHSFTKSSKLTFMRLRLGIHNDDLADRFCISLALCS